MGYSILEERNSSEGAVIAAVLLKMENPYLTRQDWWSFELLPDLKWTLR